MAIPTVGAKQLHPVQISAAERKRLAAQSRRAAQREYAGQLAADKGAFGAANRDYRTEASSVRGATSMVQQSLQQALEGLKSSGLSGRYLHAAQKQFIDQKSAAAQAVPFLLGNAAEDRTKALTEARSQLVGDRAQMQQSGAAKFNSALDSARTAGTNAIEAEAKEHTDPNLKLDAKGLATAQATFKGALRTWSENPLIKLPDGTEVHFQKAYPLKSGPDWRKWALEVYDQNKGFGLPELMAVIQKFVSTRRKVAPVKQALSPF